MTRSLSKRVTLPLVAVLATLLASCGLQEPLPAASVPSDEIAHVLTIDIAADADRAELATSYDAQVLSFRPDAGFAILGLRPGADKMFPQAETNQDALGLAEANGFSAWAGGFSAWAGGFSAWAGGVDSDNPFPANVDAWTNIGLDVAHGMGSPLGAGITVAVIDTGVDLEHVALAGKFAPSAGWYDYVGDDANPDEEYGDVGTNSANAYGHGTSAAGIILQVAPEATILPLRVLGADGRGDLSDVVLAIERALDHGADVINLSLGSTQPLTALESMISLADSMGVTVVSSVGNHNGAVLYPAAYAASYDLMVAVGSIDAADVKSGFSAYGPEVSVMAYGEGIASLYPEDGTVHATGTSFAAPFAAGAAALVASELAAAGLDGLSHGLLEGQLGQLMGSSSDASIYAVNSQEYSGALGSGRLDVGAYLSALRTQLLDATTTTTQTASGPVPTVMEGY